MTVRLFREAGIEAGTGPTLASLLGGTPDEPVTPPTPVGTEGLNADGTLQDGYEKGQDGKVVKKAAAPAAGAPQEQEGLNADGTLKEGYRKDETGKVVKEEVAADEVPEDADFWEEMEKVSGHKLQVAYPDGVDPASPEGAAVRIKAEREDAARQFEDYLRQTNPRGYAYMLHTEAGGTDEEFFDKHTTIALPDRTALEASVDAQTALYRADLRSRGLDEDSITALIEMAIKGNKLKSNALAAWDKADGQNKQLLANLEEGKRQQDLKFQNDLKTLNTEVSDTIANMSFVVTGEKKDEFLRFVNQNLRYDNGQFYLVQPVEGKNMKTMLESMFFMHQKGDLNQLVVRKAKTQTAQGIRLRVKGSSSVPGGGTNAGTNREQSLPLGSIV